jgi:hypothetical protein
MVFWWCTGWQTIRHLMGLPQGFLFISLIDMIVIKLIKVGGFENCMSLIDWDDNYMIQANGMPFYEIFWLSEIDPETRHVYEQFQKDSVAHKSAWYIDANVPAKIIVCFQNFEKEHDNLSDTWRFGITFLGYRFAKENISKHVLGETMAVQYRRSMKFKGDSNWNPTDDPLDSFLYGFESAHPWEQREEVQKYVISALLDATLEYDLVATNYSFIPTVDTPARFMREMAEHREKWI